MKKNESVLLSITGITSEGNGVGRAEGQAVFVPYTAIGDEIRAKIVKVQKGYCYGIVEEVLTPSPDRRENDCPAFFRCGGCALRHITYESELAVKEGIVYENLRRIGGVETPRLPILPSPLENRYRNKGIYPVVRDEAGAIHVGFYAKRSHRVIDQGDCLLQPACYGKFVRILKEFLQDYGISVYDEVSHTGQVRGLFLRMGYRTGEVMVCVISTQDKLPHREELVKRLLAVEPGICTVVLNVNPERTNVALGKRNVVLYGEGVITDILCGRRFEISPLSFYQVNSPATEQLYQLAAEYAGLQEGDTLLDLYCGIGTIGITMAGEDTRLIGVEVVPQAVENARRNASLNGLKRAEFYCNTAEGIVGRLEQQGLRPDVVVLDPPRKGCEASAIESVCRMGPKRVVYISCNSATLARDCRVFAEKGYGVRKARPVDLFPRTGHVECVALLTRDSVEK